MKRLKRENGTLVLEIEEEPSFVPMGSPGMGIHMSSSGFEKRQNSPLNRNNISPSAPLRCLAIITSAIPRISFPRSS